MTGSNRYDGSLSTPIECLSGQIGKVVGRSDLEIMVMDGGLWGHRGVDECTETEDHRRSPASLTNYLSVAWLWQFAAWPLSGVAS